MRITEVRFNMTCVAIVRIRVYFGYCYWDGDCRLYAKRVADSGPGSASDLVLSSWEIYRRKGGGLLRWQGELVSWVCILIESRRVFSMR